MKYKSFTFGTFFKSNSLLFKFNLVVLRTATGEICVSCGDNIEGPVKVLPDADKISVYDPDGGIRLI
ncbi:MAG: hypothetical protein SOX04_06820 [Eubacteriales bacterium]|nr:hypothetical protein [Christensenellaceae bacterium]MDY3242227.1 hypothetical protein [Eubacteriales bacterium]